ncbi:ribosomal protein L44E [Desulfobaculum xiamenense]|uniref:Ribosomal protein L44E n=1 Tax=Desulfobaculum xiamenense TaxID=995050 RepID=A0A846QHZ0_9BACT|nr:hypothetical protein [Desulfobaculum xiamenense]NJB67811.1 ribosomal protein L44E [Desulfobaculum xiamenense]
MGEKKYTVRTECPDCGVKATLHLTARELKALESTPGDAPLELSGRKQKALGGRAPRMELTCASCGKLHIEDISKTCADWDDYCKEVHPIQEV